MTILNDGVCIVNGFLAGLAHGFRTWRYIWWGARPGRAAGVGFLGQELRYVGELRVGGDGQFVVPWFLELKSLRNLGDLFFFSLRIEAFSEDDNKFDNDRFLKAEGSSGRESLRKLRQLTVWEIAAIRRLQLKVLSGIMGASLNIYLGATMEVRGIEETENYGVLWSTYLYSRTFLVEDSMGYGHGYERIIASHQSG